MYVLKTFHISLNSFYPHVVLEEQRLSKQDKVACQS